MSSNCVNSWNKPWSITEIIDSSSNWSLAGDAGLLKYMEAFSENMLSKAEETNDNLNNLLEDLSTASLSLDVVKNEFCSLHNIQFVETRVYEEDETLPADLLPENVKDTKPAEEERIQDMKEAVLRGIDVVDKYFEKVEVPASDSEDETDFPSFVLRPKDPYLDRPLPYIIGSEDWYNKWHVGLLDSSSESETDKVSEKFSDSDSESDLPVQDRSQFKGISNSGSEADLSSRRNINHPVANSTFDESVKHPDIFESSDSEEYNSVPAQAPISNRSFAQELAAKLGNVIEQNTQVIEPEVNKKPIQNATLSNGTIGNLFPDEPPPIDEGDNAMFGDSSIQQGFFSGSGVLFDDLDNTSSLWKGKKENKETPKSTLLNLFDDEDDDIFSTANPNIKNVVAENVSQHAVSKKITGGLFDDDSSEDDLFSENTNYYTPTKHILYPGGTTTVPYIDDEPPELEPKGVSNREGNIKSKKPVGGVKIFDSTDLFEQQKIGSSLKIRRQESSENSNKNEKIATNKIINESPEKVCNRSDDLFSGIGDSNINKQDVEKTFKKDYTRAKDTPKEVVSNKIAEADVNTENSIKQLSLFDDDDNDRDGGNSGGLFGDDLFSNTSTKKFSSSLFEDEPLRDDLFIASNVTESDSCSVNRPTINPDIKSQKDVGNSKLFVDVEQVCKTSKVTEQAKKNVGNFKAANLFCDESDDDTDDLFSANVITKSLPSSVTPVAAPRNVKSIMINKNVSESSKDSKIYDDRKTYVSSEDSQSSVTQKDGQAVEDKMSKNAPTSASINFFDQNPPDDDDWDTKSENNLFDVNYPTLFDNTPEVSSQRSGLFDNEPPSLFYESSGIVRDGSARVETDDSFNPYASSSRRFSSDIFNDQQSSDSFFVTKNKSNLEPHIVHSNLGSIQEISNLLVESNSYSNIDITPSGNIDDLFPDATLSVAGVSLQGQSGMKIDSTKSEQNLPEIKSDSIAKDSKELFKEPDLQDSFDTDLFRPSDKLIKNEILQTFQDVQGTENNVIVTSKATNIKPLIAAKPTSSSAKNGNVHSNTANSQDSVTSKIGSPGKLKHNLNINVSALIPGVPFPKKKDLEKSHSCEVASSYEDSVTQVSVRSSSPSSAASKSSEELAQSPKLGEKSVNFESSSDFPEILPSITKDRVRIPVKRRPSTRKARHESIRNSVADFKINVSSEQESGNGNTVMKVTETEGVSSSMENIFEKSVDIRKQEKHDWEGKQLAFDIFADDEKVFSSKTIIPAKEETLEKDLIFEKDGQLKKPQHIPLFDSVESDSLLFVGKVDNKSNIETKRNTNDGNIQNINDHRIEAEPKTLIFSEQKRSVINSDSFESADFKKCDLFDDSEEFDDIFSAKKLPPKSNILKKSLFGDELDDDDIFGPSTSVEKTTSTKRAIETKPVEKKPTKVTQVRKLENTRAVEDPLSFFNE